MEIQDILEMLAKGQITSEAANALVDKLRSALAGKVPAEEKKQYDSSEEMLAQLMPIYQEMLKTPEGKAQLRDTIAGRKSERFVKRYAPFFDAILAGADILSSLSQVRQSKEAIRDLRRPAMPAVPGIDPALDNAIRGAEIGTMDAARAVAPAQQVLQDQYAKDIAIAKAVGGGQASTLGAMGQVASMRRARGAAGLAPMIDSIRAREQGRLDGLVRTRMQQANQNYYNRARNSQLELDQYNRDAQAAGQLGSVGRLNLRNAAQSLLNQVPRVAARAFSGYQDKYDAYEDSINNSLLRVIPPRQPQTFTEADIYGAQPVQLGAQPNNYGYNPYNY